MKISKLIKPVYKRKPLKVTPDQIKHDIYQYLDNRQLPTQTIYFNYFNDKVLQPLGAFEIGIDLPIGKHTIIYTDGFTYLYEADWNTYVLLNMHGEALQVAHLSSLVEQEKLTNSDLLNRTQLLNKLLKYFDD